jgi:competence CoiA-like predicted nuclease
MKVIKEGAATLWWHGKILDCHVCGRQVMFEAGDEKGDFLISGGATLIFTCENCGKTLTLKIG